MNFPRALAGFSSWLFKPELAEDSPDNDSPDNDTVNPWRELLQKINVADLPDSSFSSDFRARGGLPSYDTPDAPQTREDYCHWLVANRS